MQLQRLRKKIIQFTKSETCIKISDTLNELHKTLDNRKLLAIYIAVLLAATLLFRHHVVRPLQYVWAAWLIHSRDSFNAVVNLGMLIPLVYLLFALYPTLHEEHAVRRGALIGFCVSLLIETLQLIFHRGYFQISDIFNNTISGGLGAAVYLGIPRFRQWLNEADEDHA